MVKGSAPLSFPALVKEDENSEDFEVFIVIDVVWLVALFLFKNEALKPKAKTKTTSTLAIIYNFFIIPLQCCLKQNGINL